MRAIFTFILIALQCALIVGCTSSTGMQQANADSSQVSVIVGQIKGIRYLPRPKVKCNHEKWICDMPPRDPPPIELAVQVVGHIYGADLPQQFTATTTSHAGIASFRVGEYQDYLIEVYSDGGVYNVPRYNFKSLNLRKYSDMLQNESETLEDIDYLVLPMLYPDDAIYWLPCFSAFKGFITMWARNFHRHLTPVAANDL